MTAKPTDHRSPQAPATPAPPGGLRALTTSPVRLLVLSTGLVGVVAAVGMAVAAEPSDRTFAASSSQVQSVLSVVAPFVGVCLLARLRPLRAVRPVRSAITTALAFAASVALFGSALGALVAVANPSVGHVWRAALAVVAGSILAQLVAQLTGTGFGLLVRRRLLACLATGLPGLLWAVMGVVPGLASARDWITPYGPARHLLEGHLGGPVLAQWLVVLALWGAGLNLLGLRWASRRSTTRSSK